MSKSTASTDKRSALTTAAMSFVGVLAAAPLVMSVYASPATVSATDDQAALAHNLSADEAYAQYAYAYTQGMLASQSSGAVAGSSAGSCDKSSDAKTLGTSTTQANAHNGHVAGTNHNNHPAMMSQSDWVKTIHNSYKTYNTATNTSTTNNTNSHNTVGSHNYSSNHVEIEDSLGVLVRTSNDSTNLNLSLSDSLNTDSHDTTTTNTTITDSFNDDIDSAIGSSNSTVTNLASHNNIDVDADVDVNSNNQTTTETTTETTNNTNNSVNDSYNTSSDDDTIIKDNELNVEVEIED